MHLKLLLVVLPLALALRDAGPRTTNSVTKYTIQMTGYSPQQVDDYVAVALEAIPGYIVGFEPVAHADRVHHMLLYGCSVPYQQAQFWRGMGTCGGSSSHILYAWARNAPNLVLPENVGFSVGHDSDSIRYFVLQVHYAQPFGGNVKDFSGVTLHISQNQPANLAAVMLFVSGEPIPPKLPQHQNNMSCVYNSETELHPFAFRTHTHAMGRVVSAFYKHDGSWNKIGIRNPQWPQLFEKITTNPVIRKGDLMAATCRFYSTDKDKWVPMGAMGTDEMCNFYMMFYWDAKKDDPFPSGAYCGAQENMQEMRAGYPKEGTELLPRHPELEHTAHQSAVPFGIIEEASYTKFGDVKLGQVSGISFDLHGNLIVFHRASRVWAGNTFDQYNVLLEKTPIPEDVILFVKFEGNTTRIVKKLGANQFYLPHGIYMGKDGFLYTTDVGSHTVAKWKINADKLELVWEHGEKLLPSSDRTHFCKPTGIVASGDHLYVTDGYCNSRVVELTLNGNRTNEFGLPGDGRSQFQLPHDIVADDKGNLLVSDRENGRVQLFTPKGDFLEMTESSLFDNIFSADVRNGGFYMIPGRKSMSRDGSEREIEVFVGRRGTGLVEYAFSTTSGPFNAPHVLRICPSSEHIFIGDMVNGQATGTIRKFKIQREGSSGSMTMPRNLGADLTLSPAMLMVMAVGLGITAFLFWRKFIRKSSNSGSFDRKGFKPLRTEEAVGFISDGSDSD